MGTGSYNTIIPTFTFHADNQVGTYLIAPTKQQKEIESDVHQLLKCSLQTFLELSNVASVGSAFNTMVRERYRFSHYLKR